MTAVGRSGAFALLACLAQIAGHALMAPPGATALAATVLATTVLTGVLLAVLAIGGWAERTAGPGPLVSRAAALRRKSWSAAYVRLRDPDAAGKSHPRAPSAGLAAA